MNPLRSLVRPLKPRARDLSAKDSPAHPLGDRAGSLFWPSAAVFLLLSAVLSAALEWRHYRPLLSLPPGASLVGGRLLLGWLLCAKTLLLLAPLVLVAALLRPLRARWATRLLLAGWTGIIFYWAVDLRVQQVVGNNASAYLPYLYDALRTGDVKQVEWSGDNSGVVRGILLVLAAVVASGLALWRTCTWLMGRLARRWTVSAGRHFSTAALTVAAFLVAGFFPAQFLTGQALTLRQVKSRLVVTLAPLDDGARAALTWLGCRSLGSAQPRVCIVSLLANPAGPDVGKEEVHLHNFTAQDVTLEGWRLQNSKGLQYPLSGGLRPGETRVINLPPDSMRLENDGDEIQLRDPTRVIHQVSYVRGEAKYGRTIHFREEGDFGEFETQLNQAVREMFQELAPRLMTAKPVEEVAAPTSAAPPNVVYFVLESLRHSAIGPEVMSRLHRLGQQGLHCQRHYAGSNSSHLGLFALLYGRSCMVFDATLDAGIPPQTVHTLRQWGYETFFLTAGDCRGFRRMDEFLNERSFDHVTTDKGEIWSDRPDRDRRVLAQVRDLFMQPSSRPRFIVVFLMSTHFPYTFSSEFEVHRPCGENVSYENWKGIDRGILYNRYRNAALFLESEILRVLKGLDPQRNLVVVTGDHGESMGEDGALAHASRGSEIQTRVPFVMVGPGVSPRSITQPTTHADALPTLLHALSGQKVPLRHAHGRDLLADGQLGESAAIFPLRWLEPYELLLIRGQERMQFNYHVSTPRMQVFGFCDEASNLDLSGRHDCSPEAAQRWAETLRNELARLAK